MKNVLHRCVRKWSIAWICSFINFMYLGVPRLSGMLYLAAISRYNVNRNQASLPFVLCYTVRNISGPFIGYLSRKVEVQTLIVLGCLISSIGLGACFFAESITTVSVLYGGVFGLGFGLSTILIPCVLNQHFDKYLNIANGISLGGECIAGFVLPPLFEFFLNTYGTSGSLLILSGLILHGVPAALFLKPPEKKLLVEDETRKPGSENSFSTTSEVRKIKEIYNDLSDSDSYLGNEVCLVAENGNCSASCKENDNMNAKLCEQAESTQSKNLQNNRGPENSLPHSSITFQNRDGGDSSNPVPVFTQLTSIIPTQDSEQYNCFQHSHNSNNSYDQPTDRRNSARYSILPIEPTSENENPKGSSLRVFLDPTFILILFTQSSIIFIATTFSTIIVDFSKDVGVSDNQTVYVLMCFSISDMLGRFCLGWVTDGGYMPSVGFSSLCYGIMGASVVTLVWLRGFPLILTTVFFYGLFLGGLIIIGPGITSEYIEADKVNIALASRFALFAPMSLTQSLMIGYFRDTLGSYNGIFYLLGLHSLICSILNLLIPATARCRERRRFGNLDVGVSSTRT